MSYSSDIFGLVSRNCAVKHFCNEKSFDDIFQIRMRDFVGNPYEYRAGNFASVESETKADKVIVRFSECRDLPGTTVELTVALGADDEVLWNISAVPGREYFKVEWMNYPQVKFIKTDSCRYLIPTAEGVILHDLELRQERAQFKCKTVEYAYNGVDSLYPAAAAAQFEALYDSECGIYIGCHDAADNPKVIDFMPHNGGAVPLLQQFTGGEGALSYSVVMRSFKGNWQDAAEIYRNWMEEFALLPEKLAGNMPEVLEKSPVVIAYPVKGFGSDAGGLIPNEYYPYSNALPVMERYNKLWDNAVMALLMHWEGTAPWAPPFIWPPSGGEELLKEYIDAMHEKGNSVGLYSSGIAWTQKSMIDPDYSLEERFIAENVADEICIGPRGEAWSSVCNHPLGQRIGYDLCPSRDYTVNLVCKEISSASKLGVDYLQYFDQNQGCASPLCYSKKHAHPELPGAWQTTAMQNLLDKAADAAGVTVLGCENAVAQPYMKVCKLNDLRNHLAWSFCGYPVALYSYLYHEYTTGFSGNGVWLHGNMDYEKTPFFPVWNLAWNFVSGNLLSVILKDKGELHWNWCQLWSVPAPEQEPLIKLIGNLSKWRRGAMKKYLLAGRMVKTPKVVSPIRLVHTKIQEPIEVPAVPASAWSDGDTTAVILANSLTEAAECSVILPESVTAQVSFAGETIELAGSKLTVKVPALDAVLITYKNIG
ncbi:MAG: hypothetical protein IJW08_01100 [Lentisphaeria bacterium]|nr:hypothetical protein [Lentisphaeria bacterium]